jgi:hypothetical protein
MSHLIGGGSGLVSAKHQRRWKVEEEVTSLFPVPTFAIDLNNTKNISFGGEEGEEKRGRGWGTGGGEGTHVTRHLQGRGEGERGGGGERGHRRRGSDPNDPAPTSPPLIGATGQWGQQQNSSSF